MTLYRVKKIVAESTMNAYDARPWQMNPLYCEQKYLAVGAVPIGWGLLYKSHDVYQSIGQPELLIQG